MNMSLRYPISVLKTQRNNLEDKLVEIEAGHYNRHPEEQLKQFEEEAAKRLRDINQGIKVLEDYIES